MDNNERMREWRARQTKKGGMNINVWLSPESAEQLIETRSSIGRVRGGFTKPMIEAAIHLLHNSVVGGSDA